MVVILLIKRRLVLDAQSVGLLCGVVEWPMPSDYPRIAPFAVRLRGLSVCFRRLERVQATGRAVAWRQHHFSLRRSAVISIRSGVPTTRCSASPLPVAELL
jgi:hypothetical protein